MQRTATTEFKHSGVSCLLTPTPTLLVQDSSLAAGFPHIYDHFPQGETVSPQGCICSMLKDKNPCQVNRNQSRDPLI